MKKAAAAHFSRKFKAKVKKSTFHSIKKDYQASVKEKQAANDDEDIEYLPVKKQASSVR